MLVCVALNAPFTLSLLLRDAADRHDQKGCPPRMKVPGPSGDRTHRADHRAGHRPVALRKARRPNVRLTIWDPRTP
jgi:hypothetical protein